MLAFKAISQFRPTNANRCVNNHEGRKLAPCTLLHIYTEVDTPHKQEIAPLRSGGVKRTQILLDVAAVKNEKAMRQRGGSKS